MQSRSVSSAGSSSSDPPKEVLGRLRTGVRELGCRGYRLRLPRSVSRELRMSVARLTTIAACLLLACVAARSASAQTSVNGSIRGYVRDATGAVLPDTTVTVAAPESPTPFIVVSDKEGYYRLLELPPGEYELSAE